MAETGKRNDPYRGYNFKVELDNTPVAAFREVGGLSVNSEMVEYREGTDGPLNPRKLTGLQKVSDITLKRGFTLSKDLWNWYKNILNGVQDRRDGAIVLEDELHQPVLRWEFKAGWLMKWEGPALNATSNDVAIEAVTIACERLELQ